MKVVNSTLNFTRKTELLRDSCEIEISIKSMHSNKTIVFFTVVCLVVKPLNMSEARVHFVVIQTFLFFVCKSLCLLFFVVSEFTFSSKAAILFYVHVTIDTGFPAAEYVLAAFSWFALTIFLFSLDF